MSNSKIWDTAIIGSGPAGLTAAIYTVRGAASTLLFAGDQWGGQLMLTTEVENYPGFPKGILGPDLMVAMRQQAERLGTQFVEKDVTAVDFNSSPFKLSTPDQQYLSRSAIIATGAETRWLDIPGEAQFRGRGVSSCAPCDAPFFKDKRVIVIGGGDSAMEEALVLAKHATSVTLVHRRDQFRASEAMQKRVFDNPKISVIWNTEVTAFLGETALQRITLKDAQTGQTRELEADGAFVAIGHAPSTSLFKSQLELDQKGYLKKIPTGDFQMSTSKAGIFVAGDVHDYRYRQAVTAAAFGCMAALEALQYLDQTNN